MRWHLLNIIVSCHLWSSANSWRCADVNILSGIKLQLETQSYARHVEIEKDGTTMSVIEYTAQGGPELSAGVLFPCGLPSAFSLKFTLRLSAMNGTARDRQWRYIFALFNRLTKTAHLQLAIRPRKHGQGGRLSVDSGSWSYISRDLRPKFNLKGLYDGNWHTFTLKIDSTGVSIHFDCSHDEKKAHSMPPLTPMPPERINNIIVLVGQKHPRDEWITNLFKGQLESARFFSDPREAFASTCLSRSSVREPTEPPTAAQERTLSGVAASPHPPRQCSRHTLGIMWYDTTVSRLKFCNGHQWKQTSPSGDCSLRYFADYANFEIRDAVDFEPFRWPDDSGQSYGGDHYVVASRIIFDRTMSESRSKQPVAERASFGCSTSIIYRWSRGGGWHPYDILQSLNTTREICNAKYTKFFTIDKARFLAVLDNGRRPAHEKSSIVIYRLTTGCLTKRFCGLVLVQRLDVYDNANYGQLFDIFSIGRKTFLAAANFRTPAACKKSGSSRPWCYEPNARSFIYEWKWKEATAGGRERVGKFEILNINITTCGATKMKHFTHRDEHFVLVANMLNSGCRAHPGSYLYRWTGSTFEFLQRIPTEGAISIETFNISGRTYAVLVNNMKTVHQGVGRPLMSITNLTADILQLQRNYSGWFLEHRQQLYMFMGVSAKHLRICNRDYLALANLHNNQHGAGAYGAVVYQWQGISGFQRLSVISDYDVSDVEHVEINGHHYLLLARLGQEDSQTLKVVTTTCGCS